MSEENLSENLKKKLAEIKQKQKELFELEHSLPKLYDDKQHISIEMLADGECRMEIFRTNFHIRLNDIKALNGIITKFLDSLVDKTEGKGNE